MKTHIPLIAVAVFGVSILLAQSFIVNPAYAQAFVVIEDMQENIRGMSYQSTTDSIWVLSESNGFTWLTQIDRSTRSTIFQYNHTQTLDDLSASRAQDIWCGKTDCFITTFGGLVIRITTENLPPDIFKGVNVTGTYNHGQSLYHITGRDEVTGGFGSITMWIDTITGTNRNPIIVDGISMTLTGTLPAYGTTGVNSHIHDLTWSGIAGVTDNHLIALEGFITDTASQDDIWIYNLATGATHCNVGMPSDNNPFSVSANYVSAGSALNKFYVGSINGIIYVFDDDCNLEQTVTTGLSGDLRFLDYDSGRLFVQETGSNAIIMQLLVNSTGHILTDTTPTYFPLPSVAQNAFDPTDTTITNARFILLAGNGQLWFPYTGADEKVGVLLYGEQDEGTETIEICYVIESTGQTFCKTYELDENGNIIIDSVIGVVNPRNVTDTSNDFFCSVGLSDCDNPDIQTNGTGMFMLLLLVVVSYAFIVYIHHIGHKPIGDIHPMMVLLIGVIDITIAFFLSWIPDYIFYTVIVVLIGLGGFGLYKIIRGQ